MLRHRSSHEPSENKRFTKAQRTSKSKSPSLKATPRGNRPQKRHQGISTGTNIELCRPFTRLTPP
ncbi:BgTH12-02326 [Blumeria graminis f. sp. triticale]|uniref:BgTH12-02326 n=1 Tax=Blumeria graminis f. sp. triticale TaxID=1689686 RepID=A0A9W4D0U9_BLUGR|nr:BgTH12-02326 [Blumeria graminis f. sp. triticale]